MGAVASVTLCFRGFPRLTRHQNMWIPTDADQLEGLISSGRLDESSVLDFKRELPANTKELAKDVAAMANDGGTLVFGIDEDAAGRPTKLNPQTLAGAAERISSMIRSALSEPPEFSVQELPKPDTPDLGYIAIVVPASPRAPHMVVVKGDNRFYGRTTKGNTALTEGEVARLYLRRNEWELDRKSYLDQVIKSMTLPPDTNFGYLFLYARPVVANPRRLSGLGDRDAQRSGLFQLISDVKQVMISQAGFKPSFGAGFLTPIADGWQSTALEGQPANPRDTLILRFHFDCETRLFLGRAAEKRDDRLVLFESGVAGTAMRFLTLSGRLLERCMYFGAVDLGLGLTGIQRAVSHNALSAHAGYLTFFDQPVYAETDRVMSTELEGRCREVARSLLDRLFHATGAIGHFDPFAALTNPE